MSAEIKYQMSALAAKAESGSFTTPLEQYTQDMAGDDVVGGESQLISHTTWTQVLFGNISGVPTFFKVKNADADNFVEFSLDNAGTKIFGLLPKGQCDKISLKSGTLYAKANVADLRIVVWAAA